MNHTPALVFSGFSSTYEDGTQALTGIDLTIGRGEKVGLIGPNGSGKTTLLRHIVGILMPENGIEVLGMPVGAGTLHDIRRAVGYVFQDSRDQLFMSRVIEDVAFGPLNMGLSREEARTRAEEALQSVGLAAYGDRIPYHLSGGEMRRVAIATALAMSPEMLVLDEPSSGLDPKAKRGLAKLLHDLDRTLFISSHDLEFIGACTGRVILLNGGRIVGDGPAQEVLGDDGLLRRAGL